MVDWLSSFVAFSYGHGNPVGISALHSRNSTFTTSKNSAIILGMIDGHTRHEKTEENNIKRDV
jgi:hypothetical protein